MTDGVSIHSLPPELLLKIFHCLSELEPLDVVDYVENHELSDTTSSTGSVTSSSNTTSDDDDYIAEYESISSNYSIASPPSPTFGWTRVTHACSLWRRVALDCAALWSTIPLDFCDDWVDELLRRSKDLPLNLIIRYSDAETETETQIIACILRLDVWDRVRRIICHNDGVPVLELVHYEIGAGMPALEELDLVGTSSPALILNTFKSLRRLVAALECEDPTLGTLSGCIHLPSLTELTLGMHGDYSFPVTLQWSRLLENLTILNMDGVHFDFNDNIIELPRLRELTICEAREVCTSFVQHVQTPFLKIYNVQYWWPPEYPEMTNLAMVEAMGFSRVFDVDATVPGLHTLVITHFVSSFYNAIAVHGWRASGPSAIIPDFPIDDSRMEPIEADLTHRIELRALPAHPERMQLKNFALVLLSHSALSTLRCLSLEVPFELELVDDISWVELLQPMHHLQHLRISPPRNGGSGTPVSILRALQRQHVDGAFVLASMQRLTLVDWNPDMSENSSDSPAVVGEVLRDIALSRLHETSLEVIHIVSWRRCYDTEWQRYLAGEGGVKIIYEHLFLTLDHVHVTDDSMDSDSESDDAKADL
ncbi:hypothetical protein PENSPDRAFT_647570 [Peniophora sp. CONT]|nr:hypothetical protein PENSPDRAFT_647570 [Peniophora sp. CONT]